jgi:hypothetical protein
MSEVSLTRSPICFVGVLRLPRLRNTLFWRCRLRDARTWREGVFSFKYRRRDETKQYHRAQQSPHDNDWFPRNENVHTRTSGDEGRGATVAIILPKWQTSFVEDRAVAVPATTPPPDRAHVIFADVVLNLRERLLILYCSEFPLLQFIHGAGTAALGWCLPVTQFWTFWLVSMVSINLGIWLYGVETGDTGESIEPEESH